MAVSASFPADKANAFFPKAGVRRPRPSARKSVEDWQKRIYTILGIDPDDESRTQSFYGARSKTIYFRHDGGKEKIRQISSRQYVLYTRVDNTLSLFDDIRKKIFPKYRDSKVIGFWRAQHSDNVVFILVDRDDLVRKKSQEEPGAFQIVAMLKKLDERAGVIYDDQSTMFTELRPFLNIVGNISDPPAIMYDPSDHEPYAKEEKPFALRCFENAKSIWEGYFTKNVSVVTKGRFQAMTGLKAFDKLTRLQNVVEKEDWFKIAVFLSPDCTPMKSLVRNDTVFDEATRLVDAKYLHFSLITNIEEYSLARAEHPVNIIPAFRLWKYGMYMLFIQDETDRGLHHRFLLCRHFAEDPYLFYYNPYSDTVGVFRVPDSAAQKRAFFYIVPRAVRSDGHIFVFDSLDDVVRTLESKSVVNTLVPARPSV